MKTKIIPGPSTGILILLLVLLAPAIFTRCGKEKWPLNGDPEKFTYLSENYAPFNYDENGVSNGISVDILESIFNRLDLSAGRSAIRFSEWADAYETVLSTPNTMLFSMVRTTERADLFKWVGPIAPHTEAIIYLKGSGILIKEISDLNNYFTGVIDGYSSIDILMDRGIYRANIIIYNSPAELYKALVLDREIQCASYSEAGHKLLIQALGYPAGDFSAPFPVHTDQLYYAFNKETADEMITSFQEQLDSIKANKAADGSSDYEKILNRYNLIQRVNEGITDQMVIDLVNRTASDLEADGPGTILKINQGLAPYKDASNPALYSFVYDTAVVLVAHADNPALAGISMAGKPDVTGRKFRDEIVQGALEKGSGWIDYIYTKPDQSGLYYKTAYYKLVTSSNSVQFIVTAGKFK